MANCIQRINALANENVTVNFCVLKGGTIANAIAEDCYSRIDVRFWNNDQWEDFLAKFKHEFEIPFGQDIQASFKILLVNPAMVVTEKTAKLKESVTKALTKFSITPKFIRSGRCLMVITSVTQVLLFWILLVDAEVNVTPLVNGLI